MTRSRLPGAAASFFQSWTDEADLPAETAAVGTAPTDESPGTPRARRRWSRAVVGLAVLGSVTASIVLPGSSANADPSSSTWHRLRQCESSDNYATNTGNGHYGAYQFDLSTWRSVGGSGYPNRASAAEQDARALILYRERGWQPWQCAGILGLHEDSDARSGRTSDIKIGSSGPANGIPAFPGTRLYVLGDNNATIKAFQNQMHKRGAFPAGTGQYGPLTLALVKTLQRSNHRPVTGNLGPITWRLAWTGKYTKPATKAPVEAPVAARPKPAPSKPAAKVPAFPGTRLYVYGDNNATIKAFQNQMHKRGVLPAGTGQYGPLTLKVIKQLQRANHRAVTGNLGPKTWRLAWTGKY